MALFSTTMQRTLGTGAASKIVGSLTCAASNPKRIILFELEFGSEDTPANAAILWQIARCSTAGTAGSNPTPAALDNADPIAATTVVGQAHSSAPTAVSNSTLLSLPLNQQASFRWVAKDGREFKQSATASNGFTVATPTISSGTPLGTCTAMFDEP